MTLTSRRLLPILLLAACVACDRAPAGGAGVASRDAPSAAGIALHVAPWALPADGRAAQPDLIVAPDGALLLSWIAVEEGDTHALRFARFADGAWSAPRTIARGADWFVNWADTPHIEATADGALWAHWLRKTAAAPYAYDVVLARSPDGGATWSAPVTVNDDGTPSEHGFVSLWPAGRDRVGIAWLDGRETGGVEAHAGHGGHGGGAMTLRAATFDAALQRGGETRVDASTCDCCQTDAVPTARGALLLYRDRADGEIRDIAATRLDGGAWSAPRIVHADGWRMPACPVNGPAVDARGRAVVAGWYTAANDAPTVKLARSDDAGTAFAAPVALDAGGAVQGRIDVALDGDAAWAVWTREDADGQSLWLARRSADLAAEQARIELARLQGRGRGTGFAKLVVRDGRAHVAWTDVVDGAPVLRGATVDVR